MGRARAYVTEIWKGNLPIMLSLELSLIGECGQGSKSRPWPRHHRLNSALGKPSLKLQKSEFTEPPFHKPRNSPFLQIYFELGTLVTGVQAVLDVVG